MGGLIIQGLQPGPELFTKYAPMTYTFFAGFVIVQFFMLLIGLGGCRIFAHISKLSDAVLIPCIFVLCVVGSFAINNSFVDVVIMFIFGIMGYLMRKLGLNTAAVVLALILGPIGERGLRRSLTLSGNDITILFSTPICWVLITLCILSSFSPLLMDWLKKENRQSKENKRNTPSYISHAKTDPRHICRSVLLCIEIISPAVPEMRLSSENG